ncbi:unnamed protein product [Malus baccata var. baccata]
MDETMKQFQKSLIELETEAEHLLLARNQMVENDRVRNGNREALTSLRKIARTTKTSVPSPFESIMKEIGGPQSRPLVKEVCPTCGNHDSNDRTWMMFPGTDVFARIPFHAAHTVLETGFLSSRFLFFILCNYLGHIPTVSVRSITLSHINMSM